MKPMSNHTVRAWGFTSLGIAAGLTLSTLPYWPHTWWSPVLAAVIGGLLLLSTGKDKEE